MSDKSRIIVDEDWKAQVEREKEAARKQASEPQEPAMEELPPANLQFVISMFATEALMALGQIPHPVSGKHEADLVQAKHLIDLLQVIEDKTKGNRDEEESAMLDGLLHELRLAFVAVQKHIESLPNPSSPLVSG